MSDTFSPSLFLATSNATALLLARPNLEPFPLNQSARPAPAREAGLTPPPPPPRGRHTSADRHRFHAGGTAATAGPEAQLSCSHGLAQYSDPRRGPRQPHGDKGGCLSSRKCFSWSCGAQRLDLTLHAANKLQTYCILSEHLANWRAALRSVEAFVDVTCDASGLIIQLEERPWVVCDASILLNRRGTGQWISPNTCPSSPRVLRACWITTPERSCADIPASRASLICCWRGMVAPWSSYATPCSALISRIQVVWPGCWLSP